MNVTLATGDMVELLLAGAPAPQCMLCPRPATLLVLHACGAPGGPACEDCWRDFLAGLALREADAIVRAGGQPVTNTCRHCNGVDLPANHVYAVALTGPTGEAAR